MSSLRSMHAAWTCTAALVAVSACASPRGSTPVEPTRTEPTREIEVPHPVALPFAMSDTGPRAETAQGTIGVESGVLVLSTPAGDPALRVETRALARGDERAVMSARSVRVDQDGAALVERERVRERFVAFEDAVAQQWSFDSAPEGAGDLTVHVGLAGARYRSTADEGVLLEVSGRTVLYGHAAFEDSASKRTRVPARWQNGEVVLTVPEAVLSAARFPATLDPVIRAESEIDAPVYGSDRATQSHPAAASAGDQALVVWSDYRTGRSYDIFGVRLDEDGERLESGAFPIAVATAAQWRPSAASVGDGYLVVWEDHRGATSAVYGTRVSAAGEVLDEGGVLLSDVGSTAYAPRVATDGTAYFVVWEHRAAAERRDVRGTLVSAAGVPSASFLVAGGVHLGVRNPVVAYGGASNPAYVVAWEDLRNSRVDVRAARVSSAGVVTDATSLLVTNDAAEQAEIAVAVNDAQALVCYEHALDVEGVRDVDVRCRAIALATGTLAAEVIPCGGEVVCATPAVHVRANDSFSVVFSEAHTGGANLLVRAVSALGALDPAAAISIESSAGTQNAPEVFDLDTDVVVAFQDDRDVSTEVYARRIDALFAPIAAATRLSTAAVRQDGVDVAWGGSGYFAVWHDARTSSGSILGARTMADGRVLDETAIAISATTTPALEPAVAGGDATYMTTWRETGRIMARRMDASGRNVDASPLVVRSGAGLARPDIAWNGTHFLIAWEEYVAGNYDIYARRFTKTGPSPDAAPLRLSTSTRRSAMVSVLAEQGDFFVAWTEDAKRVEATRIGDGSVVTIASPTLVTEVSALGATISEPSLAAGEGHVVVVWEARSPSGATVRGRALEIDGMSFLLVAERALSSGSGAVTRPSIAFGGEDFLVGWERAVGTENSDLEVQRIDELALPVAADPNVTSVAASTFDEREISLVSAGSSRWLLGYQRFDPADMFGNLRARLRFVDAGEGCVETAECSPGESCVDGVCCATACGAGATDCAACSVAAGGETDGVCGPLRAALVSGHVCRDAAGVCDAEETCAAGTTSCPADLMLPSSELCRPSAHICDPEDYCDGTSVTCPPETSGSTCGPGDLEVAFTSLPVLRAGVAKTYSILVSSIGADATYGTVTLTHVVPSDLALVAAQGAPDWSCGIAGQTVTCSHTGPVWSATSLAAVTVTVTPGSAAMSALLEVAISGMENDSLAANDTASVLRDVCGAAEGGSPCPCEAGHVDVGGTCELIVTCAELECGLVHRTCSETPNAHCLDACEIGYVWDGTIGACRFPITCSQLSCGFGCTNATLSTDAYCNAGACASGEGVSLATGLCGACAGGATTCTGPGTTGRRLLANGPSTSCLCETTANYFYDQGQNAVFACDADADGWTSARVIEERSAATQTSAPAVYANARCTPRTVMRFVLEGDEPGASRIVNLSTPVPLFETGTNDGDSVATGPSYPTSSGSAIPPVLRNSLTKACVAPPGDVNGNGLADVHEGGGDDPSGFSGDAAAYFDVYTRFAFYFELNVGYYVPPVSGAHGSYHVEERDRSIAVGTDRFPFDVDTSAPFGTHWRECRRETDMDVTAGAAPIVGNADFVELAALSGPDAWPGMDHPSQFKCVHYVRPDLYDAGVAPATGPVSVEAFPEMVTYDPMTMSIRRTYRASGTVHETLAWTVQACALEASYSPSGIDSVNPDVPTFTCTNAPATLPNAYGASQAEWTGWAVVGYENATTFSPHVGPLPEYRRGCINECLVDGTEACAGAETSGDRGMWCLSSATDSYGHIRCHASCAPNALHVDPTPSSSRDLWMCGGIAGTDWEGADPHGAGGTYMLRGDVDVTGIGVPSDGSTFTPSLSGGTYTLVPR